MGNSACVTNTLDVYKTTRIAGASVDAGAYEQPTALPVQLVYFNGWKDGKQNKLVWQSASEINNDFYTLEKSGDGINFFPIAFVDGAGNSNTLLNYQSVDPDAERTATYRLKQTNFDGSYSYSQLVVIKNSSVEIVSLYPNPAADHIEVIIQSNEAEEIYYGFTDAHGKEYFQQQKVIVEGSSLIHVDLTGFARGVYLFYAHTRSGTSRAFKTFTVN